MDDTFSDELHAYDAGIQTEILENKGGCRLSLDYVGKSLLKSTIYNCHTRPILEFQLS